MISTLYIVLVSAVYVMADRYAPEPKFVNLGGLTMMVLMSCFLTAGLIGWHLPEIFQEKLHWSAGPGWLIRTAQVFGGIGGFLIALRAAVVLQYITVVAIFASIGFLVIGYVIGL